MQTVSHPHHWLEQPNASTSAPAQTLSIAALPNPVISHIFSHLTVQEEVAQRQINSRFRTIVDDIRAPRAGDNNPQLQPHRLTQLTAYFETPRILDYIATRYNTNWHLPHNIDDIFTRTCHENNDRHTLMPALHALVDYRGPRDEHLNRQRALSSAIEYGQLAMVNRLLTFDDVNPANNDNHAVSRAAWLNRPTVVARLIQDPRVDPCMSDHLLLCTSACRGYHEVVNALLTHPRVDPTFNSSEALRYAAINGYLEVVDCLLNDGRADPAARNHSAIRYAAQDGNLPVVERLLQDPRVDPAAENQQALCWAAKQGHLPVVNRLLQDPRVDPRVNDQEALRLARLANHPEVVARLERT